MPGWGQDRPLSKRALPEKTSWASFWKISSDRIPKAKVKAPPPGVCGLSYAGPASAARLLCCADR